MIKGDGRTKIVYMYDKELTDRYEIERLGICVCTPRKKQQGQFALSTERAQADRDIAKERITIERNMEELRNYAGSGGMNKIISEVDIADHEAQVACGLVNLDPPITDW
ncbi:hypothetical protein SARC_11049 [Sphaeroforma arctica JP610]|uniref:Uncharacterized protein n=1 Tax=Sphaeroforma arctica JP610 TaxID=667725 RepID=A0A0L0FK84_9EUKA|nr:hypothetical protein SARC_11049 [Sphaeroforma arctica JP610]KNC76448.1 hypothetical protein SARC_11049 [Sphaeroforma arctica JP610]|eukprot:XP_014150350.1 hypothetical protein SARC_11049 [Sphaeroforma arctica JP610]